MKTIVIKNYPTRLPINSTILHTFLLYYFKVDNFWWGVFIPLFIIYWALCIYAISKEERVDVFKDEQLKKSFQQRLTELAAKRKLNNQ